MSHIHTIDQNELIDYFQAVSGWSQLEDQNFIIDNLSEFCILYKISVEQIHTFWLCFATTSRISINKTTLTDFKTFLSKKCVKKQNENKIKRKPKRRTTSKRVLKEVDVNRLEFENMGNSPEKVAKIEEETSPNIDAQSILIKNDKMTEMFESKKKVFNDRKSSKEVVLHIGDTEIPDIKFPNVKEMTPNLLNYNEKGMTINLDSITKGLKSRLNCTKYDYIPITSSHVNEQWSIGYVYKNFGEQDAPISITNVILSDTNNFVKLNFSKVKTTVSLFQGQVLRIYGTNPTGQEIFVQKCEWENLENELKYETANHNFILGIGHGPFTLDGDLDHVGLSVLAENFVSNVNVLILIGPFITKDHNIVQNNNSDEQFLLENFIKCVQQKFSTVEHIILANSYKDINSIQITPQKEQNFENLKKKYSYISENKSFSFLSEPGRLTVGNVKIYCSGSPLIDVLMKNEACSKWASKAVVKIDRIVKHIFKQQHFYPSIDKQTNVDFEQIDDYLNYEGENPNLVIYGSNMKPTVHGNVINVGQVLSRGMAGYFTKVLFSKDGNENKFGFTACDVYKI